ncbi:redox-sensing transcriptional repressor Rex [Acetohalobium arabaticum]|uniref:Redox-sensing transcriptional repressor Rex n=1 Tax=Acetohalobium arabaticum (strain ATCC 49924 / DSM 5501 / Z-7288) TaxID=574087 RepID=D9QUI5_ACEAZ|nr:redox-sensing transcriptional repressor Rex [Acetohalobium arabaticum]ADL13786.1 CoA-binding domain protein [Acetohalobium arabaticum DSM 5501]
MKKTITPTTTIERLPIYYRCLQRLNKMNVDIISSQELGDKIGIPSTQVRKDLSYYGEFGRRGVGYEVPVLLKHLRKILGLDQVWEVALVGAGNLGHALVNYGGFRKLGLKIDYVFDADPNKIGKKFAGLKIHDVSKLQEVVKENGIKVGIIVVPAEHAQSIADDLIDAGVEALWNFAPTHLKVPQEIELKDEDLSIGLISLAYHLSQD